MDKTLLALLVLAIFKSISCQPVDRCLLSRLDIVSCSYKNINLQRAGPNQYSIHNTRLRTANDGTPECVVRASDQQIRPITTLGNEDLKLLYSPGFPEGVPYKNNLLVEYNIQCKEDQSMFINITHLDIQGEDCNIGSGIKVCEDYIQISHGDSGIIYSELCGNNTQQLNLEFGNANVIFRTSESIQGVGFQMVAICFRETDTNLPGIRCTSSSNFSQSICNTTKNVGCTYRGDTTLRLNKDMSMMGQMVKQKREVDDQQFLERTILSNEMVNYTSNTITVFDQDNDVILEHSNTPLLQTLEESGETQSFIGSVNVDRNPHFSGPGFLVVIGRTAYFQEFIFTPPELSLDIPEVFEAIKSYEDCNPVLRSKARAILQYYKVNGINVERMMKFSITCDYDESLHCEVDDRFAPALEGLTTCQINDQVPVTCDPFYSSYIPSSVVVNRIIVRAINCNGQRAVSEVRITS